MASTASSADAAAPLTNFRDRAGHLVRQAGFGLGVSALGNLYREVDGSAARLAVDRAWDAGVRYFDTAPFYGFGLSERRIGDALRDRPRDSFILSTKVGRLLKPARAASGRHGFRSSMPFDPVFDDSYDGVMRSFEDSLQRLGLGRIDVLLMHDLGCETHGADHDRRFKEAMDGGYRALDDLRAAGVVGAIGMGVNEVAICEAVLPHTNFDLLLLAGRYTLLDQSALSGFFVKCMREDVAIVAAGVFNSGILASGVSQADALHFNYERASDEIVEQVRRIEAVCDRHDVPIRAAALQFSRAHPAILMALVGTASAREVEDALKASAWPIPAALWDDLRSEGLLSAEAPIPA